VFEYIRPQVQVFALPKNEEGNENVSKNRYRKGKASHPVTVPHAGAGVRHASGNYPDGGRG